MPFGKESNIHTYVYGEMQPNCVKQRKKGKKTYKKVKEKFKTKKNI